MSKPNNSGFQGEVNFQNISELKKCKNPTHVVIDLGSSYYAIGIQALTSPPTSLQVYDLEFNQPLNQKVQSVALVDMQHSEVNPNVDLQSVHFYPKAKQLLENAKGDTFAFFHDFKNRLFTSESQIDQVKLDAPIIHSANNRSATICVSVLFKAFFFQMLRKLATKTTGACDGIVVTLLIPSFTNPTEHKAFIVECFKQAVEYFQSHLPDIVVENKDKIPYYFRFESEAIAAVKMVLNEIEQVSKMSQTQINRGDVAKIPIRTFIKNNPSILQRFNTQDIGGFTLDSIDLTKVGNTFQTKEFAINIAGQTIDHIITNILTTQFGDLMIMNHPSLYEWANKLKEVEFKLENSDQAQIENLQKIQNLSTFESNKCPWYQHEILLYHLCYLKLLLQDLTHKELKTQAINHLTPMFQKSIDQTLLDQLSELSRAANQKELFVQILKNMKPSVRSSYISILVTSQQLKQSRSNFASGKQILLEILQFAISEERNKLPKELSQIPEDEFDKIEFGMYHEKIEKIYTYEQLQQYFKDNDSNKYIKILNNLYRRESDKLFSLYRDDLSKTDSIQFLRDIGIDLYFGATTEQQQQQIYDYLCKKCTDFSSINKSQIERIVPQNEQVEEQIEQIENLYQMVNSYKQLHDILFGSQIDNNKARIQWLFEQIEKLFAKSSSLINIVTKQKILKVFDLAFMFDLFVDVDDILANLMMQQVENSKFEILDSLFQNAQERIQHESTIGLFTILNNINYVSSGEKNTQDYKCQIQIVVNPRSIIDIKKSVGSEMIKHAANKFNYIMMLFYWLMQDNIVKSVINETNKEDSQYHKEKLQSPDRQISDAAKNAYIQALTKCIKIENLQLMFKKVNMTQEQLLQLLQIDYNKQLVENIIKFLTGYITTIVHDNWLNITKIASILKTYAEKEFEAPTFFIGGGAKSQIINQFCNNIVKPTIIRPITSFSPLEQLKQHIQKDQPFYFAIDDQLALTRGALSTQLQQQQLTKSNIQGKLEVQQYFMSIDGVTNAKILFNLQNNASTQKTRLSIDQGTNGSIGYFIESNITFIQYVTQIDDFCILTKQDYQRLQKADDLNNLPAKMSSICIIIFAEIKKFALQFGDKYIKNDKVNIQAFLNMFKNEMISHIQLQKLFSFDGIDNLTKKQSSNTAKQFEPLIQQNQIPNEKIKQARGMNKNKAELVQQGDPQQNNSFEAAFIENWKVKLYETTHGIRYPNDPMIQIKIPAQTNVFGNDQEILMNLPLSKIFCSQMLFFKNRYMRKIDNIDKIINDLVISFTVPCSASPDHLTFIRWCAKESGFSDNISFIHEPTSAFAHIYYYYLSNQQKTIKDGIYVVVDSGAGTTDVSVINLKNQTNDENQVSNPLIISKLHFGINMAGKDVDDAIKQKIGLQNLLQLGEKYILNGKVVDIYSERQLQLINSQFSQRMSCSYNYKEKKYTDILITITAESPKQVEIFESIKINKPTDVFEYIKTESVINQITILKIAIKGSVIGPIVEEQSRKICNFVKIGLIESAGGIYLDDEKDHVQFGLNHYNFVTNEVLRNLLNKYQQQYNQQVAEYSVEFESFQMFEEVTHKIPARTVLHNTLFYITTDWDGIRFTLKAGKASVEVFIANSQLKLLGIIEKDEIQRQFKYLVGLKPVLFTTETEKMNDPIQKEKSQLEELRRGKYTIQIIIKAMFQKKWQQVYEGNQEIQWK